MTSLLGLEGKRILVLGGGLGMGKATVKLIATHGAHVAVMDRELDRAQSVVADVTASGGSAMAFSFDALDDDALVAGIAGVERDFGPLDAGHQRFPDLSGQVLVEGRFVDRPGIRESGRFGLR